MDTGVKGEKVGDDYDEVWTKRSAESLRQFMGGAVPVGATRQTSKSEGSGNINRKGGKGKETSRKKFKKSEEQGKKNIHGYEEGVQLGFSVFKEYAKSVDPTGGWGEVTMEKAKSFVGSDQKNG